MARICANCVLPDTYPGACLDDQGVCSFCRDFIRPTLMGEDALVSKIRARRGKTYDCALGISGGKDSCYVAYLACKLGLRALAVFYDFPFIRDLARENARKVCEAIGIELRIINTTNSLEYGLLRNHLLSLAPSGTTWGQCVFCHYGIDAVLYNTATTEGIPFILSGTTANEVWWNPGKRTDILLRRLKQLSLVDKARFAYYQLKAYAYLVDQRRQFNIPLNSCFSAYSRPRLPANGPELLHVFDYIHWDQNVIETVLREETGWTKPEKKLSWRYDCILEPLLDFTYLKEFGISTVGLYLCGLIRNGLLTRDEALQLQAESENSERLRQSVQNAFQFLALPEGAQQAFFENGVFADPKH